MSADEQQAAEDHVEAVRRWLAEPSPKLTLTMERLHGVLGQVDRLRAELAETRAAGDKLTQVASEIYAFTSTDAHRDRERARLIAQVRAWESGRGDAPAAAAADSGAAGSNLEDAPVPAESPAVELPVTLSSVDDVVAVFRSVPGMSERAGPGSKRVYQDPRGVYLGVVFGPGPVGLVVDVFGCDGDRYSFQGPRLSRDAVLAAIEAARGGSR